MSILKIILKNVYELLLKEDGVTVNKVDWRSGATWEPFLNRVKVRRSSCFGVSQAMVE